MKKPEEIKKGLFVCSDLEGNCPYCPYAVNSKPEPEGMCVKELANDALAYIQQLEAENNELKKEKDRLELDITIREIQKNALIRSGERLEKELDAAVADLNDIQECSTCKYDPDNPMEDRPGVCFECCTTKCNYEWRGLPEGD